MLVLQLAPAHLSKLELDTVYPAEQGSPPQEFILLVVEFIKNGRLC
jgi:hypothetical protein